MSLPRAGLQRTTLTQASPSLLALVGRVERVSLPLQPLATQALTAARRMLAAPAAHHSRLCARAWSTQTQALRVTPGVSPRMQAAELIEEATRTAERAVLALSQEPEEAAGSRAVARSSRQALEPEVVADTLPT